MPREVIFKTRNEKLSYTIDFTGDKPSAAATIASKTANVVSSDGTVVTALVIGALTNSGAVVSIPLLANLTDKDTYTLTVEVTFNDSPATVAARVVDIRVRDRDTVE